MAPRKKTTDNSRPATPAKKPAARKKTTTADQASVAKRDGEAAPPAVTKRRKTAAAEPAATSASQQQTSGARKSAGAAKNNLVIVESPAKARTIQKYLGAGYEVLACYGHIRDLPPRPPRGQIGIDIDAGWVPTYVNLDDDRHKKVLAELKKRAAKAALVYLASDPDREGESIAWHLKEALGLSDERIRRVAFNEITRKAIQDAFAHATAIDMERVRAQEARRFLDRAVGYKISPLLRKKLAQRQLSAGRVQSVAVRLVVEREREIQAFRPEEYWKVLALLSPEGTLKPALVPVKARVRKKPADATEAKEGQEENGLEVPAGAFQAELAEWQGQKFQARTEADTTGILAALEAAAYSVLKVEQKDRVEKAPPPFITSTLQQQANIRLGFRTERTMKVAQELYQGVALGDEGSVGLITYMRTDSTHLAEEALKACRDHILATYGQAYLPAQPNRYASGKAAQEAHEAIRPTDLAYTPERVAPFLDDAQRKLYELIYRRFVACQMNPAVFAVTNVDVEAVNPGPETPSRGLLKAQGKILKFDGYRKALSPRGKQEDATLPPLADKQKLDLLDLLGSQHFTQPPPRYNEASLVKALEKEGIGRPSTYASIISKIQEREYVRQLERRLHATQKGMLVTDKLVQHFPDVMDYKFTSQMEGKLDQIEESHLPWRQVLDEFWGPFSQALESAHGEMQEVAGIETGEKCPECGKPLVIKYSQKTRHGEFVGCSGYPECKYIKPREGEEARPAPILTEHPCPTCGKPMVQREGRSGTFLGCSAYPECKTTMNLDAEGKPVLSSKPTEHNCDKCGKPMILREGKRGPFLTCSGYPKCKNAVDVDASGNPIKPIETGVTCDKCGKPMAVRKGARGPFLGCTGYPKCRNAKPLPDELKEKVKDLMPPAAKKEAPEIAVRETCPECNAAMKVRMSKRGPFLGCTKYPKCKGTREATPEVLEQLQAAGPA